MRISDWSSDVCSSDLQSFEVELASSGQTFHIPPDKTVLEILAANGIAIPVSCAHGICGTCVTRVLRGEPDHRALFMTDQEHAANDPFTPCLSRARHTPHSLCSDERPAWREVVRRGGVLGGWV